LNTPTPSATDHRHTKRAGSVPTTLQSALAKEPDASIDRVLQIAEGLSDLPNGAYPCLNPKCRNPCTYPAKGTRGHRPQRFCSRECRLKFERAQSRLAWEVRRLEELRELPMTTRLGVLLNREISRRQWALDRYPTLEAEVGQPKSPANGNEPR